jgi:anhydro-N-acetylmuramic acid kinase
MSGTSTDGLDVALCRFWRDETRRWHYQLLAAESFEYETGLRHKMAEANEMRALDLAQFEVELSRVWAKNVNQFLAQQAVKPNLIAMHGHTVFHRPEEGLTFQIGKGALMAEWCGVTTICDFRTGDVALGGQGAPLVPAGDELLFGQYEACLNLGGIANISYRNGGKRIAYDIVPCNMALNLLAGALCLDYDPQGENAEKGIMNETLLNRLNELAFYRLSGAKSLSKEWFESQFLPLLQETALSTYDKLRTVSEHIAAQIGRHICQSKATQILVTGGGAKNNFLIQLIQKEIDSKLIIPEQTLIDYKEAIIFAFLGTLRLHGETNCLADVTGAWRDSCGGGIYFAGNTINN